MSTGCMSKKLVGNHDNHRHGNNLGTILLTLCSISALSVGSSFVPPQDRAERWLISRTAAGYQAYTFSSFRRPPHKSEAGAPPSTQPRSQVLSPSRCHPRERKIKESVCQFKQWETEGNIMTGQKKKCIIDNAANTIRGTTGQT